MLCIQQRFKVDDNFNFEDWKAGQDAAKHPTGFQFAVFESTHILTLYKWKKNGNST